MSILICHKCPHRHRPCAGPCPCTLDGRDIIDHAQANYCPLGKFGGDKPVGWEDGPKLPPPAPVPVSSQRGPGDVVKIVLAKLGYKAAGDCGCESMRQKMNAWGWWGCWKHRQEITAWFATKAREQGITVDGRGVMALLIAARRKPR